MKFLIHVIASIAFAVAFLWHVFAGAPASNTAITQSVAIPSYMVSTSAVPAAPTISNAAVQEPATKNTNTETSKDTANAAPTLPNGSAWQDSVPLGDGKYVTSAPRQGYVYLCHVQSGGQGASGNPTWIHGSTWTPSEKVAVEGSVAWNQASYSMKVAGGSREITANDLPTDHNTGIFPIQASDPAYQFDRNPNSIHAQTFSITLPAYPSEAASPSCISGQVGIMDDGVPLFDGFDAEYRDAVAHETQDAWNGHPDESSVYHDHGFETGPVKEPVSTVVGFAFDGFPITGSKLPNGNYLHTADLDECHGITSTIMLDGKDVTTYHYVLTQDFPYSASCFRGRSFEPKPGAVQESGGAIQQSSGTQTGTPGQPPQAAIDACTGTSVNASCSFSTPNGLINGVCRIPPNQSSIACVPQ